jgi:hypothetical protein
LKAVWGRIGSSDYCANCGEDPRALIPDYGSHYLHPEGFS